MKQKTTALVLSGGGNRGALQAERQLANPPKYSRWRRIRRVVERLIPRYRLQALDSSGQHLREVV